MDNLTNHINSAMRKDNIHGLLESLDSYNSPSRGKSYTMTFVIETAREDERWLRDVNNLASKPSKLFFTITQRNSHWGRYIKTNRKLSFEAYLRDYI